MNYLHDTMRRLIGKDERHFCPTTPMAGMRELHLYYPLATLQKEIEKRTFYLGKYRRPADANGNEANTPPHLLDLIGMSRDESDVLYPFAKAAMADVYDHLNRATTGYPKLYDWEDKKAETFTLADNTQSLAALLSAGRSASVTTPSTSVSSGGEYAVVSGTISIVQGTGGYITTGANSEAQLLSQIYVSRVPVTVSLTIRRQIKSSGETIGRTKKVEMVLDKEYVVYDELEGSAGSYTGVKYNILPYKVETALEAETDIATAEYIYAVSQVDYDLAGVMSGIPYVKEPRELKAGDRFKFGTDTTVYETREDVNENDLRNGELPEFVLPLTDNEIYFEEGIHYYIGMPAFLDESLVTPLDNAILEALVNRIIWKWLTLSYPAEAVAYDTFYQQAVDAIKERCNIFHKNWVNRTPRMF